MTQADGTASPFRYSGPQLIAYVDRFGGSLKDLAQLMRTRLAGVFAGLPILPFYIAFDGADAGFDPVDHTQVDARLGSWDDVRSLSADTTIVADLIANHMSVASPQFDSVQALGEGSPWFPMFLTMRSIFPDGAKEEDLARIYRPRPALPFTLMRLGGAPRLVWTTFTPSQVDLDIREPLTWSYLTSVVDRLTAAGVSIIRLDAIGYAAKVAGTNCFMTPETLEFIGRLGEYCHHQGARTLLEVHGHVTQQIESAQHADLVYDFALPPLVLHAIFTGDPEPLDHWLTERPHNVVTVLDTHDGIGIIDVAANELEPSKPGLLDDAQIANLVETIHSNAGGTSRRATGTAAANLDLYQVNCTFFDALGRDGRRYLLARAIQLFVPGIPQVYYVGLLAGANDMALFERTGVGRDVNRHCYSVDEVERQLLLPVVSAQIELIRLRATHPAFEGVFGHDAHEGRIVLRWHQGEEEVLLDADVLRGDFTIRISGQESVVLTSNDLLGENDQRLAPGA